ncbi:MAG: alpha/beta fold hydrolase [Pseudonocardiaceae bacterium]|nr:alpha/beta fold hydrolase [Pseudonocardiaceae bacterium]
MTGGPVSTWATPTRVGVELVELQRADGQPLDALWYGSAGGGAGVLHVHGKGSSVLSGPSRFLPPLLPDLSHLAVNMRCHDLAYTVGTDDFAVDGGMWEDLSTGHLDVAAGIEHLRQRGLEQVVVCGHSSGGFYAADYMTRDGGIAAWVLLSPLTTNKTPLPSWFPEPAQLAAAERMARDMVDAGRGRDLIPLRGWFHAISAASLVQRFEEPDGVWLDSVRHATAPVLMAWGDAEPRHGLWGRLYDQFAGPGDRREVLPGAGHYYRGQERVLATRIGVFLADVLGMKTTSAG